jgi:hypothetical protein
MQVIDVTQSRAVSAVPLYSAKPGRVVCFADLEGVKNYYLVPKWTKLEAAQICVPAGKRMLTNLETGRVVFKSETLMVYLTSCTAEAYLRSA